MKITIENENDAPHIYILITAQDKPHILRDETIEMDFIHKKKRWYATLRKKELWDDDE